MRNKKIILLCSAIGLMMSAAGCGEKQGSVPSAPAVSASPSVVPSPSVKQTPIHVFFGSKDLTALIQKETTISYTRDEDKYLAALNALKISPSADAVALCPNMTYHSAKLAAGKLTVDLKLNDQDRLGSGGEAMLLDAFKKTIFQFPEIESFEVLVGGKKTDSLMGHMELQYPFKRSSN
jgi:hypothetical protein